MAVAKDCVGIDPMVAREKARKPPQKRTTKALSFVPVVVESARSADAPSVIEIILPNRLRVRVTAEIEESSLLRVVRALGRHNVQREQDAHLRGEATSVEVSERELDALLDGIDVDTPAGKSRRVRVHCEKSRTRARSC